VTLNYRKVAAYGAIASLPWGIISGYMESVSFRTTHYFVLLAVTLLAGLTEAVTLGALGGILFIRIKDRLPTKSITGKAMILSVIVWLFDELSAFLFGFDLSQYPTWFFNQWGIGSLIGLLIWALIIAHFIDSEVKKQPHPFHATRPFKTREVLNGNVQVSRR